MQFMQYDINSQMNPFEKDEYVRLLQRHIHSMAAENTRLNRELDELKKNHDIPSAYPGSTFGLVYQERKIRSTFAIEKVIFNPPATIVLWLDGTKTIVKCKDGEEFSEWDGIALCLAKKLYGPNFHKIFRAHCSDPEKTVNDMSDSEITDAVRQATKGMHEASRQAKCLFEEFLNELGRNFPRTDAK